MIEDMAELHLTEAELARDVHGVMERVRQGAEVIVERDAEPVAVIKSPQFRGRSIDECIALIKAHGSHATLDDEFAKDLEAIIDSRREPLNPPEWD
jgi:antitoxin (DNA-binding transcriptional repressor) of toxin-antitoxin stability system